MEQLLLQQNYSRVVFLGDGAGDLCPSTRLGPRDFVLSREFYPTGNTTPFDLCYQGAT
jgi:hypothetical protein